MSESSSSTPLSTPSNTPTAVTASLSSSSVINGFGNPHRISKDSPAHGFKSATDKKGRSTSCLLCQKRKQKCDHRLPSCTTCIKAGVECVQPLKYSVKAPEKDEYTVMLEKKVKFLEKIIDTNNIVVESKNKKSSFKFKKFSPFIKDEAQTETDIIAGTNATGSSITQEQYQHSLVANYNLVEFITLEPLFSIDEQSSKLMLDIYFSQIHFKYPLLNEDETYDFHNTFISDQKTQPQPQPQQQQQQNDLLYNLNCAKLFCVFAIGSVLYMSTHYRSGIKTDHPSRYFATCLMHLMECGDKLGYEDKVKMLNLIVLYLIRTDFDSNLLHDIIKDALNISVYKLNLNKSLTYQNLPFDKKQNYLRIWWCNYLLERSIAISVGRPYSIPEYQIDEELPMILKPFIIQSIKLRRIESKFVEFFKLSSIKQISNLNLLKKLDEFFQLLEKWRMKIENNISNHEMETLRLYYYRSIRLLIQPFLEILDPNEKLFKECQAAAGQICQLFKKFHENTVHGHSTTAIHSVFNAGVTLIYCLWITRNKDDERRRALGDLSKHTRPQVSQSLFISMNDLRACSICLYVMNERSKFALAFRNIFDQLMFATINNLIERCGEDSSEIIYTNKPGMPPAIVRKYQYIPEYLEYHKQQDDAADRDDGRNTSAIFNNDDSPTSNGGTDSDERSETGSNRSRKYGLNPHIKNLINNSKLYGDDKERMIKQNNLQKSIIPKSLSHLLINSADGTSSKSSTSPSSSANSSSSSSSNNNKTTNSNSSNTNPTALNEQIPSLPSPHSKSFMATPMANGNRHSSISSMTNAAAAAAAAGTSGVLDSPIPELQLDSQLRFPNPNIRSSNSNRTNNSMDNSNSNSLFLNVTTNTMISNISNWTEIAGGMPILPTDLPQAAFNFPPQYTNQPSPQQQQQVNQLHLQTGQHPSFGNPQHPGNNLIGPQQHQHQLNLNPYEQQDQQQQFTNNLDPSSNNHSNNNNGNQGFKLNYNMNAVEEFWKYGQAGHGPAQGAVNLGNSSNSNGNGNNSGNGHGSGNGNGNGSFGF